MPFSQFTLIPLIASEVTHALKSTTQTRLGTGHQCIPGAGDNGSFSGELLLLGGKNL